MCVLYFQSYKGLFMMADVCIVFSELQGFVYDGRCLYCIFRVMRGLFMMADVCIVFSEL